MRGYGGLAGRAGQRAEEGLTPHGCQVAAPPLQQEPPTCGLLEKRRGKGLSSMLGPSPGRGKGTTADVVLRRMGTQR